MTIRRSLTLAAALRLAMIWTALDMGNTPA
jgi:hypothetical protein